jgi:hypothetical protein
MEREQAEASGRKLSKRELMEMGNRPVSDSGRRTPPDDWFATVQASPHKPLEVFLAEESQPKPRSDAWKRLEALFSKPKETVDE